MNEQRDTGKLATYLARAAIGCALLVFVLILTSRVSRGPTWPFAPQAPETPRLVRINASEPEIRADAFLIARLRNGEVLAGRSPDTRLQIASLTKLMTGLILAETLSPLEAIAFSSEAKRVGGADDKRSDVRAGETLKAEDVMRMMFVASDNDAAYAAAEFVAGRMHPDMRGRFSELITAFVARMNERAGELGISNTHFSNPAGRDAPENFSTARDMLHLVGVITREHPELWAMSRTEETFIFSEGGERHSLVNTDPLVGEYPSIYGSKTGFDDQARGALALVYQLSADERIGIVILKSPDRIRDGRAAIQWVESSFKLEQ